MVYAFKHPDAIKLDHPNAFIRVTNTMRNSERNAWARAKYPGLQQKDPTGPAAFMINWEGRVTDPYYPPARKNKFQRRRSHGQPLWHL